MSRPPSTVEFLDDASNQPEELPPPGPGGVPRLLVGVLAALALVVVLVVVTRRNDHDAVARPSPSSSAATRDAVVPVQTFAPPPHIRAPATDPLLVEVHRAATGQLVGDRAFPRNRSCEVAGRDPSLAAVHVITRHLPGFRVRDSSEVHRQGRLCAIQLRAIDTSGTVVTVLVERSTSGAVDHVIDFGVGAVDGAYVEYSRAAVDGWTIVAGSSGPGGDQPVPERLTRTATDPALRW